jgi:hypothetical protein
MNTPQNNLVQNFLDSLVRFDAALDRVPVDGLDWAEKDGEWTVREVIHHVAEDCNVYAFIIERALATPGCNIILGEFPGNEPWGKALAWDMRPVEPARNLMHAHRVFLADMLLSLPDQWENTVHFKDESGKELVERNVIQMVEMLTEHMDEHTQMIEKIIATNAR